MKINIFNESRIFPQQNKFNKNAVITTIQNKIISKSKEKQKTDTDTITKTLNTDTDLDSEKKSKGCMSFLIDDVNESYQALNDTFSSISTNADLYNKYSKKLKDTNLSDDKKKEIENAQDNIKEDITQLSSPEYINKLESLYKPSIDRDIKLVESVTGNTNDSSLNFSSLIPSAEDLGLKSNKNMTLDQILDEVKNAENNFDKRMSKLDDIATKYGINDEISKSNDSNKNNSLGIVDLYA
ncbi:MAG: hypothetical protein PHX70_11835 [Clostridium sp.]|nr:hypothetical protein [Clostridium sp.]